jgi:hypothetical protein
MLPIVGMVKHTKIGVCKFPVSELSGTSNANKQTFTVL